MIGKGRLLSPIPHLHRSHALGWDSDGNVHASVLGSRVPRWGLLVRATGLPGRVGPARKTPPWTLQRGRGARSNRQAVPGPSTPAEAQPTSLASLWLNDDNHDLLQQPSLQPAAPGRHLGEDAGRAAAHRFRAAPTPLRPGSALCWSRGLGAAGKAPPVQPGGILHHPRRNVFFVCLSLGEFWEMAPG